ncbi:MAG TPA: hypothetical protein VMW38_16375 [Terriglobia bacterium]|nr:hypothetical protein [Terriglobia bacterium]
MKPSSKAEQLSKSQCMSDIDLYSYLARAPGDRSLANLEAHISTCSHCLDELAELIKLLHPESEQAGQQRQETSPVEILRARVQNHSLSSSRLHQVLNTLPEEEFFSRGIDILSLFHSGLDVSRGLTPSQFLSGPRKSGKTEILKRVYNRLFLEQSTVIPFYHSIPKSLASAEVFCREYFLNSVIQLLAFLKREPELMAAEGLNPNTVFQLAYESRRPWLVELVDHFHAGAQKKDLQVLAKLALHFPVTASVRGGYCAFVIVDDFHHMASLKSEEELALLTQSFLNTLQSRQAPYLLSIPSMQVLHDLFKAAEFPGSAEVYPLKPLDVQGARRVLEGLCNHFGVAFEKDLSVPIIEQLEHKPFYIRAIVQGARRNQAHLQSLRKFAEVYVAELTEGSLHLYFNGLFNSAKLNSLERIKALELLHASSRLHMDASVLEYFRRESPREGWDPVRVLNALEEVHLIETSMGSVRPIEDKVLADWIEWNVQHTLHGLPRTQATYRTTADLLIHLHEGLQFREESDRLERLERLLGLMNCQLIPSCLLDFDQLASVEQNQEPEKLGPFLASQEQILLPEILSVNHQRVKPSTDAHYSWTLLTALGFEDGHYVDGTDTTWVAAYCLGRDPVGLNEIQDFFIQSQRLVKETRLERVHLWLVAESRFNRAAMSFAHDKGIMTSSPLQFALLESQILPAPLKNEEHILSSDLTSYELTIPCSPDSELVAMRALEQVSEIIDFEEKAKGQVRTAVMEACINAKETAGSPKAKIHLQYKAGQNCLITQLRVDLPAGKEQTLGKPSAKTWNLSLLQALMDDVRVVHTHLGWELTMIKYQRESIPPEAPL